MRRLILGAFLFGCFIQPAFAADKYFFILKAIGNPYWQALKQGIEDTSKAAGIDAVLLYPVNDLEKEQDFDLCQSAITQQPKIIVMGAETTAIGLECYREAQAKGILVADMDATITMALAQKSGIDLQYSTGADNSLIGEKVAEFVATQLQGKVDNPKVLVIEGTVGSPPGQDRPLRSRRN